jgi:hypothetical protein
MLSREYLILKNGVTMFAFMFEDTLPASRKLTAPSARTHAAESDGRLHGGEMLR